MRSLLSVDDIIRGLREYLVTAGEWSNTHLIFTSDHGYTLGGFRDDSHKIQEYDHVTRVPLVVHGPGLLGGGAEVAIPASMSDIGPTILEPAGGIMDAGPEGPDSISFARQLRDTAAAAAWPRDAVLIEYQSLSGGPGTYGRGCSAAAVFTSEAEAA